MLEGLTHLAGWLALAALLTSLALSLASRMLRAQRAGLVAWRRLAGLGGFALALAHATVACTGVLGPSSIADGVAMVSAIPYLRHGALALALLTALALTSFPKLNARIGLRTWQTLHRAVYVAVALAALHVLAGPSADPRAALAVAVLGALLLLSRLLPRARAASKNDDEASGDVVEVTRESADSP